MNEKRREKIESILELEEIAQRFREHSIPPLSDYFGTELKSSDPCPWCRHVRGEVIDISEFEPQTTDDPAINSEIARSIAKKIIEEIGTPPQNDEEFVKYLRKVLDIFKTYVNYDEVHANASRHWRTMAYTYMTADEALRLGRGICGELSLALMSILRSIGIPTVLERPAYSHIDLIVQNPTTGTKYRIDPTFGTVEKAPDILIRKSATEESNYIYGPIRLEEFWKTTLRRRRRLGEKYIGEDYTPEEALDYEYARHCIYPLPYGTEKGRKYLEYLKEIGYCQELFTPNEKTEAMIFGSEIAECPRPEDPTVPEEEKLSCYRKVWEKFRRSLEYYRREIARLRLRRR